MTIGEREYERHRQTTPNGKLAESYFDLGGVRGPVCEVIDAMAADNDRLRRELEELQAELARMRPVVEAAADFDEWCGDERCASGTCRIARAMNEYRASRGKEGE